MSEIVEKTATTWKWRTDEGVEMTLPAGHTPTPGTLWTVSDFDFLEAPQAFKERLVAALHQRGLLRQVQLWPPDAAQLVTDALYEAAALDVLTIIRRLKKQQEV